MRKIYLLLFLVLIFVVSSCNRDSVIEPEPPPQISVTGAYILSEGSFNATTSQLSFYNIPDDTFSVSIFNPGNLGLFPSGLIKQDNYIYIAEQGNFGSPGKVYKLDTNGTVVSVNNSVGMNPYSLAYSNGKIYVTNGPASNVTVLDAVTLNFITEITVGVYPQEIVALGNRVFVCNTSLYGGAEDSTVSVINSNADSVEKTITLRKDPGSIIVNNDYRIVVGCSGGSNMIYFIDKDTLGIVDSAYVPDGFGTNIAVDGETSNIYFISGNGNVVRLNQQTKFSEIVINAGSSSFFYGYNFDWRNRKHYVLDARDFASPGSLHIFSIGGTFEKSFNTGIAPRRVIFK